MCNLLNYNNLATHTKVLYTSGDQNSVCSSLATHQFLESRCTSCLRVVCYVTNMGLQVFVDDICAFYSPALHFSQIYLPLHCY